MGTNCAPLVADLLLFSYERYYMSLSEDNQFDVIKAFYSTFLYLDDLLNIDNNFYDSMVNRIYLSGLQLNKGQHVRYRGLIFGFTFIYIVWFC